MCNLFSVKKFLTYLGNYYRHRRSFVRKGEFRQGAGIKKSFWIRPPPPSGVKRNKNLWNCSLFWLLSPLKAGSCQLGSSPDKPPLKEIFPGPAICLQPGWRLLFLTKCQTFPLMNRCPRGWPGILYKRQPSSLLSQHKTFLFYRTAGWPVDR